MTPAAITLFRRSGVWYARTNNKHMPAVCRTVPVFPQDDDRNSWEFEKVRKEVQACNVGTIVLSIEGKW